MSVGSVLPDVLAVPACAAWEIFCAQAQARGIPPSQFESRLDELHFVWACSQFVAQSCQRQPEMFAGLWASGDLWRSYASEELRQRVNAQIESLADEAALKHYLRRLRQREMVRIAWRDLTGLSPLEEVMADLSDLAEVCIDSALSWLHQWQSREVGVPCDAGGVPQAMVVLGMGKLGARELNFSSDVDLIFAYPEEGETRGGRRSLTNEEYFRRLGQRLISAIDQVTADGQVFRVDMRLRPFGESGPLAASFAGLEDYYQSQGREWERYAMIKARVIAGDQVAGAQLMKILRPFVYRRYLDYGAFESLREMKQMIAAEVRRKGMLDNVKLGPGGIREIEFIGQAFQLIRGGREPELQERRIQLILPRLVEKNCLPEYVVRELLHAYDFLRKVEHRLQEYQDAQTHRLPTDELGQLRLAISMGFADWSSFGYELTRLRNKVQGQFDQVFAAPQAEQKDDGLLAAVWQGALAEEQALAVLRDAGYGEPSSALTQLAALQASHSVRALSEQGRRRLNQLMPLLLGAVANTDTPGVTLERLVELVERIARRSAYLSLLLEHPMALSQLAMLCGASPWISQLLVKHPLLLDELLDPRMLYSPPKKEQLVQELTVALGGRDEADQEQQLDTLRHFKQINVLRVAAADAVGAIPLMEVSDHLSWIAEVLLQQVLALAWSEMTRKHGAPTSFVDGGEYACGFIIVAYGKLGGIELGYGSDLDLVFLHGADEGSTQGDKPLANEVFEARLGQRIIHLLTVPTSAGVLYEVDMRLRPSGASGMLVSSLPTFRDYQREDAWTWEHQALVRARVVAGDPVLAAGFEQVRAEVLCRPRDRAVLQREVREMRERMRNQLAQKKDGMFDLKQGAGGIADIEFMVQYGVLGWAQTHPGLCEYTDNIRLLQRLAEYDVISVSDAEVLCEIYRTLRSRVHQLTLQNQPAMVSETAFVDQRAEVGRVWRLLMGQ